MWHFLSEPCQGKVVWCGSRQPEATFRFIESRLQPSKSHHGVPIQHSNGHSINFKDDVSSLQLAKSLQSWLRKIISRAADLKELGDHDNFVALGMVSAQLNVAVIEINSFAIDIAGRSRTANITMDDIKSNPSISTLAHAIVNAMHKQETPISMDASRSLGSSMQVQNLLLAYMKDLPTGTAKFVGERERPTCVMLVGSTGSIGSYVLHNLLQTSQVGYIFCLNRSVTAFERQTRSHREKGLATDFPPSRVTFLHGIMTSQDFGLSQSVRDEVRQNVTHIILNAWPMRWSLPLSAFEPSFQALRRLIDFSASSPNRPPIMYMSSIAAFLHSASPIPERSYKSSAITGPTGYSQSKNIGERLLDAASEQSGIRHIVCRVCQTAGPVLNKENKGTWNPFEWAPMLIASSRYMGKVPASLGGNETIDWIPVDIIAQVLVELLMLKEESDGAPGARVYNVVNPRVSTWHSLIPAVLAYRNSDDEKPLEVVSLRAWVDCLQSSPRSRLNPAANIMEFYRDLADGAGGSAPRFDTTETAKRSAVLAGTQAVNKEWMDRWMRQWKFPAGWVKWEEEGLRGWKRSEIGGAKL